jgi:peptidoglycan LD-endopeptidase LytH
MLRLAYTTGALLCVLTAQASRLVWPVPGDAFAAGRPFAEFVQPTASGEPESALFGCVRSEGNRFHEGLDLAPVLARRRGEASDPVGAIHDGVVVHINAVAGNSSYGRYVVLEHPDLAPGLYSLYAHLASVTDGLRPGARLSAGAPLGIMGRSAGGYTIPRARAHLHLEVGLRLSDSFDAWFDRQGYKSPNHHGNFNGMNLMGWDPLDYFSAFRDGRARSPLEYLESIPPAVLLHIRTGRLPDFLRRYPQLWLDGCPEDQRAGWEVVLSAWGLPLSLKPLRAGELRGAPGAGDISVLAIDREALSAYACRRIVTVENDVVRLDAGGRQLLEILFMPD